MYQSPYRSKKIKAKGRQRWLAAFEQRVVAKRPELRGKIVWDAAIFFYNEREPIDQAVDKYCETY